MPTKYGSILQWKYCSTTGASCYSNSDGFKDARCLGGERFDPTCIYRLHAVHPSNTILFPVFLFYYKNNLKYYINIFHWTVSDLRAALTLRGLSTEGLKVDLVNRLQTRLDEEEFGMVDAPVVPVATTTTPTTPMAVPDLDATGDTEQSHEEPDSTTGTTAEEEQEEPVAEDKEPQTKTAVATTTEESHEPKTVPAIASEVSTTSTTTAVLAADAPESTVVIPKITPDMTFDEKRRIRAARFNIPVAGTGARDTKMQSKAPGVVAATADTASTRNKRGPNHVSSVEDAGGNKKPKVVQQPVEEEELLPKEEIERRLKRLQKFSGEANALAIDKLKSMLRKYRFMKKD